MRTPPLLLRSCTGRLQPDAVWRVSSSYPRLDSGVFSLPVATDKRAGMAPVLGWVMGEKELGGAVRELHARARRLTFPPFLGALEF